MSLRDQLGESMKAAMRSRDRKRLSVLRMVLSELKVADASGKEVDELAVVKSYASKLKKAAEQYDGLGLQDKADEAREEMAVVEEFMPAQMGEGQLAELVAKLIEENSYGPRDMGKVMKAVMAEYGDQVDGRTVQQIAKQKLDERD